jgi:hypothetical protein
MLRRWWAPVVALVAVVVVVALVVGALLLRQPSVPADRHVAVPYVQTLIPGNPLPGVDVSPANSKAIAARARAIWDLGNCGGAMVDDPAAALAGGDRWQRYMDTYLARTKAANRSVYTEDSNELQQLDASDGAAMRALWFGVYEGCRITKFDVDGIREDEGSIYVRFQVAWQVKPIPGLKTRVYDSATIVGWDPPRQLWQVYRLRSVDGTLRLIESANVDPPRPGPAD